MNALMRLLDGNEREVQRLRKTVAVINSLEPEIERYTDAQLREKTEELRARIRPYVEKYDEAREQRRLAKDPETEARTDAAVKDAYAVLEEALNEALPEAFALVREASRRTIGLRHYDVQMVGGMVLHQGRIAEMATGEGKTLVATLPLYLNALAGKGGHLITVNDYLAKRDACWMGPIYHLLGLRVGVIQSHPHLAAYVYDPDYRSETDPNMHFMRPVETNWYGWPLRQQAYECDIVYGTNAEFGFDYLRDNMAHSLDTLSQRDLHYAIVDEVDSILIDEARTPLIISGEPQESSDLYYRVDRVIARLQHERDYTVDEKQKTAMLTDEGVPRVEEGLGVANIADDVELMHHINAALKARFCYKRDVEYVVKDGQVIIVDEFTGRLMFGRRYSDGLHQAIEAKENVKIEEETVTVATITLQNYFRLYRKLAGMTGTAKTEEAEFRKIYGMDVCVVPTHMPMIRQDHSDVIYKTEEQKFRGVVQEILQRHVRGQPMLVGTRSIEVSERLSEWLLNERLQLQCAILLLRNRLYQTKGLSKEKEAELHTALNQPLAEMDIGRLSPAARALGMKTDPLAAENFEELKRLLQVETEEQAQVLRRALRDGIAHAVLNAKYHEKEAQIIQDAGRSHAVTIATNMAGRGVDIILGGKPPEGFKGTNADYEFVKSVGGLAIVGSERHESRRIDRQLRGRSGRQGDPGASRFYLSLGDELWRLFGDRGRWALGSWPEHEPIESRMLTMAIERAQKKVEERNFGIRKHTLEYDDVMNVHRDVIYRERRKILEGADLRDTIIDHASLMAERIVTQHCSTEVHPEEWDLRAVCTELENLLGVRRLFTPAEFEGRSQDEVLEIVDDRIEKRYLEKEREWAEASGNIRDAERFYTLQIIDQKWIEHLNAMDYLREGIYLRGYGQQDPLVAYKKEAFEMFEGLQSSIQDAMVAVMFHVVPQVQQAPAQRRIFVPVEGDGEEPEAVGPDGRNGRGMAGRGARKVGRNDPCPCGSGKKYKQCCLKSVSR
ncbi:MAG: preprotein translocase subunit SecA [Armatimonadetes bacterium]|nr:preprotein translocase subunit SecA [Armatimonadota bacterium]